MSVGSVGSVTATSRCQPSFSSLMCWIATALAFASRSGRAWYSETQQRKIVVRDRELASLVVEIEDDILAKIRERHLAAERCLQLPHLAGPGLEVEIMRHAALQRDGIVLGAPRRFATGAGVATLAMLDNLGGALQRRHLADAGNIAPVPAQPKFEVLVRVKALWIDDEFRHERVPLSVATPARVRSAAAPRVAGSGSRRTPPASTARSPPRC